MSKKKILVIGHSGGVAQEIYLQFKNRFKLKFLSRKKIDALIDYKNYYKEIIKFNPEFVINCIAITGIKYCENHIDDAYFINAVLPKLLSNYCYKIDAKFIHFSTDAVFEGRIFKKKYNENSKSNPTTIYGKSKRMAEISLSKSKNTLIIRIPLLYGPTQKKHLIFKLINQLQNNKKVFASTDIYSTPVYTPLLVKFIKEKIIENDNFFKLKIKNNLINYSSNHYISIYSLVKVFAKILKKEKNLIAVKDKFFDKYSTKPKYLGLKSAKKHSTDCTIKSCAKLLLKKIS